METREEWRAWLAKHHGKESEIWLVYNKKQSGRPRVAYAEAVEEALCFGWIDGITKPMDENRYAQRFTPRREKSNWSPLNRQRFARLVNEGRMTPAGLARRPTRSSVPARPPARSVPAYIRAALARNRAAERFFRELAPSYRRLYVRWIDSAKREETRQKRLREAISKLAQRRKPGLES
ncbi:MAG TPA: YdeI/OmpD-associated family protein [Thermoanaerobaculia bacterium]|nr:YdeI/OmpD-associated family protein [Thermoanaerobaculia bacterium]